MGICTSKKDKYIPKSFKTIKVSQKSHVDETNDPNYDVKKVINEERITKLRKRFCTPKEDYEMYFYSLVSYDRKQND